MLLRICLDFFFGLLGDVYMGYPRPVNDTLQISVKRCLSLLVLIGQTFHHVLTVLLRVSVKKFDSFQISQVISRCIWD